tara:strand:+ start:711 stop:899 length:189 start_codon:yes stop_codon:yes gene_type:complete
MYKKPNYRKNLQFDIVKDIAPDKPKFNEIFEIPATKKKAGTTTQKKKKKVNKTKKPYKKGSK